MATLDDEIDALYRLAPDAFTAARNELAKRAGTRTAEVKALVKPNAPAWAVNQLYWHRRPVFDALAKASEAMRAAHVRQVAGKSADRELADARHRAALDAAVDAAIAFLKNAGDAASPATVDALVRTLEAVPSPEIRGRLARPLESIGFSGFAALMAGKGPGASARQPADVVVMKRRGETVTDTSVGAAPRGRPSKGDASKAAEEARKAAEARKQERDRVKKALASAQAKEREAAAALTKARQAAERAAARVEEVEKDLDEARKALEDRRDDAERARRAINDAVAARVAIERQLQGTEPRG